MKVATWRGESRFSLDDVPEPAPGAGQVLVAVHTAGICGTDVHATQGLFPWKPPLVLGHEYTGVIVDVGPRVNRGLIGQAVACEPSYGCGECAECREHRVSHCQRLTRAGGFAERVVLPTHAVHLLPAGLDPATAALTEPAACCLAGLEMVKLPRNATVLVIGGGIMGFSPWPSQNGAELRERSCPTHSSSAGRRRGASARTTSSIPRTRISGTRSGR